MSLRDIERIEKQHKNLKTSLKKKTTKKVKKDERKLIYDCKNKKELENYTVVELKEFIEENKIDTKKLSKKTKKEYIELIWKNLKKHKNKKCLDSDSDSCSDCDYTDSECDSCDSYSDSDSD